MRWPRGRRRIGRDSARAQGEGHDQTDPLTRARLRMVNDQLEARGVRDEEILRAFRRVPRHRFVEGDDPYGDRALPVGAGQTISQPYVVARMTLAARPARPDGWAGAHVLEIGTGSGYQAALLAELGARVISIERHAELADHARRTLDAEGYGEDRVSIEVGDGTEGWPSGAPYDAIIVTAGGPSVPGPLLEQLHPEGGRLVMPVGDREHQFLTLVERDGRELRSTELEPVVFVPLIGRYGIAE